MAIARLKNHTVYLVGPIDKCSGLGKAWRDDMTKFCQKLKIRVLDPLDKPLEGASEIEMRDERAVLKKERKWGQLRKIMKRIRAVDLRFVDKCDFLIVNMDLDTPMCGTWEELFLANRSRKPIIVMCPQGKGQISDWLYGTIPHNLFFDNWDKVKKYLMKVHTAKTVNTIGNRWLFFTR